MQLSLRQRAGSAAHAACHMLALGPPTSLMVPFQSARRVMARTSSMTDLRLRDAMRLP
jgi:hypothetical protein